jgi:hypothetical protein
MGPTILIPLGNSLILREVGVVDWLGDFQGTALQRVMAPCVPLVLLYWLKSLYGAESIHALPPLLFSYEALMRLVGFKAHEVQQGVCQRGALKRQGPASGGVHLPRHLVRAGLLASVPIEALPG